MLTGTGAGIPATGYFNGRPIDISDRYENGTFVSRNLQSYANAMDACGSLIFVGLKDSMCPFNVFAFEAGHACIAVYDHDLALLDRLYFEYGTAVQIKSEQHGERYHCTVLFHNGCIVQFDYLPGQRAGPADRIVGMRLVENEMKVVKFAKSSRMLAYTDGFRVARILNGKKMASEKFKILLIDMAIVRHAGKERICVLNRAGNVISCLPDFSDLEEIDNHFRFTQLIHIENYDTLIVSDGFANRKQLPFRSYSKAERLAGRLFLSTFDGTVVVQRLIKGKRFLASLFRVVSKEQGVVFCTSSAEINFFKDEWLFVLGLKEFDGYFVLATENGLLLRVAFTEP